MLFVALLAASTAQFTFRSALEGEWELERTKQGAIVRARYSLRGDGPRALEGDYFEEGADGGVEKSMRVRVDFSDDNAGDFQIARLAAPPPADAGEAPDPVPEPALKTAFSFDFAPLHGGRYLLSETPRKGGIVQFMMLGRDHFVLSQYATTDGSPAVTTWTAARAGAAAPGAAGAPPKRGGGGLWSRWSWVLVPSIVILAARKALAGK